MTRRGRNTHDFTGRGGGVMKGSPSLQINQRLGSGSSFRKGKVRGILGARENGEEAHVCLHDFSPQQGGEAVTHGAPKGSNSLESYNHTAGS